MSFGLKRSINLSKMIHRVQHNKQSKAKEIWALFQESYQKEALLLNVETFPPLERSYTEIQTSNSEFWAYFDEFDMAGVIEIEVNSSTIHIVSLLVKPCYFRQGIGTKLIDYILGALPWKKVEVQTAIANQPAIQLYKKRGFVEEKSWVADEGIELVKLTQLA